LARQQEGINNDEAAGIRSTEEGVVQGFRHKMSRKQLVGITGQKVQAGGSREVLALVEGRTGL